jgi:hypothetical protein
MDITAFLYGAKLVSSGIESDPYFILGYTSNSGFSIIKYWYANSNIATTYFVTRQTNMANSKLLSYMSRLGRTIYAY